MNGKNEKKVDFIKMPLLAFRKMFPEVAQMLPPVLLLTNDEQYVVKFYPERGALEVGYEEDNWLLDKAAEQ